MNEIKKKWLIFTWMGLKLLTLLILRGSTIGSTMKILNRSKSNLNIGQHGPILTDHHRSLLNLSFITDEIKNTILDGYNNKFYKTTWPIVGEDIVHAIFQFFENGKMLQSWNTTTITLIPMWMSISPRWLSPNLLLSCSI